MTEESVENLYRILKKAPLFFVVGINTIENLNSCVSIAKQIKKSTQDVPLPVIFKASFDKANRTEYSGYRGVGLGKGLEILKAVKNETKLPILTDIHEPWQADIVAKVVDILQIPAFLCRQTDLIKAAAATGKIVNIKKGQWCNTDVAIAASRKAKCCGNSNVILCERGTNFGYHDLFVDMTNFAKLKVEGDLALFDVTHACQKPGLGKRGGMVCSDGSTTYLQTLCEAAIASGTNGVFIEVHPDPDSAPVDGNCQLPLSKLQNLVHSLTKMGLVLNDREPKITKNEPRALPTLQKLCQSYEFKTILDVGSGPGKHSELFKQRGKQVTACDIGISPNYEHGIAIEGDYMKLNFGEGFDAIWCCHVLEHQRNVGFFLEKLFDDLKEEGVLAITVPPKKSSIVGGHLTLWNAGLLLYNLILAGFDCADASVASYGYNVSVIVRKRAIKDFPTICYDKGDIEVLAPYFPSVLHVHQLFDGDIRSVNWDEAKCLPPPRLFL